MATLATLLIALGLKTDDYYEGLEKTKKKSKDTLSEISGQMERAGKSMSSAGAAMTAGITLPLLAAGGAAVAFSTQFNAGLANVASLGDEAAAHIGQWKPMVQDLAVEVGKGTGDMTDGLYQVVSAFGAADDSIRILEINAKAATGGLASTSEAINLTSAVTKAYGDTSAAAVQQVADLALQTVSLGQTNFPQLAGSIGLVTPLASSLGVRMEELFGVMATATGVTGGAAEVSTQLRGVLQSLMAPTDSMATLMGSMGYSTGAAMLQGEGLQKTIAAIVAASEASGEPLQKYIGSIEGQTLALALAGPQADVFSEKLLAMENAAGTADKAFLQQTDGVNKAGFAMQQAGVKAQVIAERLGDALAPALLDAMDAAEPLIQALERAVKAFADMDPATQRNIINLVALTAAAGPVLTVIGSMVTGAGHLVGAFGAIKGGAVALSITLGTTVGALAMVAGAAAAVVAAGAMVYKTHKDIERGVEDTQSKWQAWVDSQVEGGATAVEVADRYIAKQQEIRKVLDDANPIARAAIGNQEQLTANHGAAAQAIQRAAGSYSEYRTALEQVAKANGLAIDSNGNLVRSVSTGYGAAWDEVVEKNYALSEAMFETSVQARGYAEAVHAAGGITGVLGVDFRQAAEEAEVLGAALQEIPATAVEIGASMTIVQESLDQAGQAGADVTGKMAALEYQFSEATLAERQLQSDMALLADAFAYGSIGAEQMGAMMRQAADGTLVLTEAERSALQASTDHAAALLESAQAAEELGVKQLNLAQSLKGATDAQIAQTAISELTTAYQNGALSFADYQTAVSGVQEAFGLTDEKSRALAGGLLEVNAALLDGHLPASNYDEALKFLITDAEDGSVNIGLLLEKFGNTPAAAEIAAGALGETVTHLEGVATAATTTATNVAAAFTTPDWAGTGIHVGEGVASGMLSSIPQIEEAARAVGAAAKAALDAELQIQSPSQEGATRGAYFVEGVAIGVTQSAGMLTGAVQDVSVQMTQAFQPETVTASTSQAPATSSGGGISIYIDAINITSSAGDPSGIDSQVRAGITSAVEEARSRGQL